MENYEREMTEEEQFHITITTRTRMKMELQREMYMREIQSRTSYFATQEDEKQYKPEEPERK